MKLCETRKGITGSYLKFAKVCLTDLSKASSDHRDSSKNMSKMKLYIYIYIWYFLNIANGEIT